MQHGRQEKRTGRLVLALECKELTFWYAFSVLGFAGLTDLPATRRLQSAFVPSENTSQNTFTYSRNSFFIRHLRPDCRQDPVCQSGKGETLQVDKTGTRKVG